MINTLPLLFIHKNLLAEVPKKSNVIRIVFQHPDPEVVQPVLTALIEILLGSCGNPSLGGSF